VGDSVDLTEALKRTMGYPAFRPGQEALIRSALERRDALGILPTGGGKSVCFQLPAFLLPGLVLVVSPLISLMEDQVGRARKVGLRADFLSSTTPESQRGPVMERALAGETDMLLVAPERFLVPRFRELLPRLPVALLAVDEAHCISHWGHDFRPAYLRIGEVRPPLAVPVLALTATATPRVRDEIVGSLKLVEPTRVVGSFDRPNLTWILTRARGHGEKVRAIRRLLRGREGATIVYASTRRSVEAVRRALAAGGVLAMAYHAGLSPRRRSEVQGRFLEDPSPVVVATNAFGMGIDRPDVRLVIHYQLSGSLEAYYQEAGRAGRDGDPGRCVALWDPGDRRVHDAFASMSHPGSREVRATLRWVTRNLRTGVPEAPSPTLIAQEARLAGGEEEVRGCLGALSRAGVLALDGEVVTLLNPKADLSLLTDLRRIARAQIDAVDGYARERRCRRRNILSYFGEGTGEGPCGRCDRCRDRLGDGVRRGFRRLVALFSRGGNL